MAEAAVPSRVVMPRWASLAGLVYVVLFVIGAVLMFGGPSGDDPPAEFRRYFSDAGHRDRISLGWVLAGLGLFAFLWFLGALREHVRAVDGGGFWTVLTTIGGAVYAAVAMASIGLNVGIRTMSDDTYQHQVFPELIHAADDAGYLMHEQANAERIARRGLLFALLVATVVFGGLLVAWEVYVAFFLDFPGFG